MGAIQGKFFVLCQGKFSHLEMGLMAFHAMGVSTGELIPMGIVMANGTGRQNSEAVPLSGGKSGVMARLAFQGVVGRSKRKSLVGDLPRGFRPRVSFPRPIPDERTERKENDNRHGSPNAVKIIL